MFDFKDVDGDAAAVAAACPLGVLLSISMCSGCARAWKGKRAYHPASRFIGININVLIELLNRIIPAPVFGVFELAPGSIHVELASAEEAPSLISPVVFSNTLILYPTHPP